MEDIFNKIKSFLSSDYEDIGIPMYPISKIDNILEKFGFEDTQRFETNGWQIDFWKTYANGDREIELSGSLYYGEYKLRKLWDE